MYRRCAQRCASAAAVADVVAARAAADEHDDASIFERRHVARRQPEQAVFDTCRRARRWRGSSEQRIMANEDSNCRSRIRIGARL